MRQVETKATDLFGGDAHILIGGTGRSGTSLLVQILTHLNFDTGFSKDEVLKRVDSLSKAGLERNLFDKNLPHVIKSPWFADQIAEALERGLRIEAAIVPFRSLFDAAESRRHVYRQAERLGKDPITHPGSIWKTGVPGEQESALTRQLYKFLEPLIARNIPLYFLSFPRFVEDPDYFFEQLEPIFVPHNVQREDVLKAHGQIVDPSLITRFPETFAAPAETPVRQQILSTGGPISRSRVDTYLSPASFQWPEYLVEQSAWIDHAPFAFWLMETHRPRSFVELGTYGGYSYFTFCQAAEALGLDMHCCAVDTWKGDEHAGFYGEAVYQRVRDHNDRHYPAFSRLVRSSFDEAVAHFADASIDLLHIDGRHLYEDVKHDFETWRRKLSERAVVLFHDTNVRERNFGVFRFWEELQAEFPSFEFLHGHGLGVLGYGANLPDGVRAFLTATNDANVASEVRLTYNRLGATLKSKVQAQNTQSQLTARLSKQEALTGALEAELAARDAVIRALQNSTSWRITAPLRAVSQRARWFLPYARRATKLLSWLSRGPA